MSAPGMPNAPGQPSRMVKRGDWDHDDAQARGVPGDWNDDEAQATKGVPRDWGDWSGIAQAGRSVPEDWGDWGDLGDWGDWGGWGDWGDRENGGDEEDGGDRSGIVQAAKSVFGDRASEDDPKLDGRNIKTAAGRPRQRVYPVYYGPAIVMGGMDGMDGMDRVDGRDGLGERWMWM
ncbi:hypothetical protein VTI28DRAFT_6067 [Corynascus sepedonium]